MSCRVLCGPWTLSLACTALVSQAAFKCLCQTLAIFSGVPCAWPASVSTVISHGCKQKVSQHTPIPPSCLCSHHRDQHLASRNRMTLVLSYTGLGCYRDLPSFQGSPGAWARSPWGSSQGLELVPTRDFWSPSWGSTEPLLLRRESRRAWATSRCGELLGVGIGVAAVCVMRGGGRLPRPSR